MSEIDKTDDGKLRFKIAAHVSGGVGIQFLRPINWIVLTNTEAIAMAFSLLDHAGVKYTPVINRDHVVSAAFEALEDNDSESAHLILRHAMGASEK